MRDYSLVHVSDAVLLRDLGQLVNRDRITTAELLAHLAEVDARRLYVPAGYPSMFAYCTEELRFSEDAASKRIQAARAARRFPVLFAALAEGRLHLTAVCLLAPHLDARNAGELIEVASGRRKSDLQAYLAGRFPTSDATCSATALPMVAQHAPAHVDMHATLAPSSDRFLVRLTIPKSTHEKLVRAQALLSHAVPNGDLVQVLDRALDALIAKVERRKIGAPQAQARMSVASRARGSLTGTRSRRGSRIESRHIPAQIRRAVWERDEGRCTFVAASGRRCAERRFLEFDHVEPVARGGSATVNGVRLRCRAHNQYEAEQVFGAGFMSQKREEARLASARARAERAARERARAEAEARAQAAARERIQDIVGGLRGLGCRADEARLAAEYARSLQGATFEEQLRAALKFVSRRSIRGGAQALSPYEMRPGP